MAERVLASTERSERLITSLLLLARVERGTHARDTVDLSRAVKETIDEARPEAMAADVGLEASLHPATVTGDAQLLRRMIANLLENAIRYNHPGGFVKVVVKSHGDLVQLAVRNSCDPLPQSTLVEMFEPFRRGSDARTHSSKGSGLGLSIVRSIVVAHDGSVRAASIDRVGVEVSVALPLSKVRLEG